MKFKELYCDQFGSLFGVSEMVQNLSLFLSPFALSTSRHPTYVGDLADGTWPKSNYGNSVRTCALTSTSPPWHSPWHSMWIPRRFSLQSFEDPIRNIVIFVQGVSSDCDIVPRARNPTTSRPHSSPRSTSSAPYQRLVSQLVAGVVRRHRPEALVGGASGP